MNQTLDSTALVAAVSGALADPDADDRAALLSVVTVARSIFDAAASSVFLFEAATGELVFEAVAGEGEGTLLGARFPADRGIAGWVVASGEPVSVDDLGGNALFARELADRTGYLPTAIMAAPIVHRDELIGVLQVLDASPRSRSSMADLDLLTLFAQQAAWSLDSLVRGRAVHDVLATGGGELVRLASMVRLLRELEPEQRTQGLRLLDALHEMLSTLVR